MLAVVEDDQQLLVAQVRDEGLLQAPRRTRAHPEHVRHRTHDRAGIAYCGQLTEPRAIPEPGQHLARDLQRESGLADPAHPGEGDNTRSLECIGDPHQLEVAAHERTRLQRQVPRERIQRA